MGQTQELFPRVKKIYRRLPRRFHLGALAHPVLSFATDIYARALGFTFPNKFGWDWKLEMLLEKYEHDTVLLARERIKPGMTVLDIGAHIGYYTRIFSELVGPSGKVIACEADAKNFALLEKNTRGYSNVILVNKAITDHDGEVSFHMVKESTGCHSVVEPETAHETVTVPATTVDALIKNLDLITVEFIKMDVEGGEPRVFDGMRSLLRQKSPLQIIMEFSHESLSHARVTPSFFLSQLVGYDFALHEILPRGSARTITPELQNELILYPTGYANLLLTKNIHPTLRDEHKAILFVAPFGFNARLINFVEFVAARALARHGWRVYALTRQEQPNQFSETRYGVSIYRYTSFIKGLFFALRMIALKKISVLHINHLRNNPLGLASAVLAKLRGIPFIFTEYGLLHDPFIVEDRENPLAGEIAPQKAICSLWGVIKGVKNSLSSSPIKNYLYHWPLTHADSVVFVSKHNLALAKKMGITNYSYLPQILDNEQWGENDAAAHSSDYDKATLLSNKKYALFVGQLKARKGWDIFLDAIPHIPANIVPYFAVVTSTSDHTPDFFTQRVTRLGINNRVIFLGTLFDRSVLRDVYKKSEVIVVPSRYEGFGLVVTEAFEMERPLVATNVIAINETVIDGENGVLVNPEDPKELARGIERAVCDTVLSEKIIRGGAETIKGFSSEEAHNRWLIFYYDFVASLYT